MGCMLVIHEMKMMEVEILTDTFLPWHTCPLSTTKAKSEEGGSSSSLTLLTRCQQRAAFASGGYRTGWVLHRARTEPDLTPIFADVDLQ